MLGLNVTYRMKPGKREEFLAQVTAQGILAAIRAEEGCLGYRYFCSVEDPDQLLLVERWTDEQAQATHMGQPHMKQLAAIKEICALDTKLERYQL